MKVHFESPLFAIDNNIAQSFACDVKYGYEALKIILKLCIIHFEMQMHNHLGTRGTLLYHMDPVDVLSTNAQSTERHVLMISKDEAWLVIHNRLWTADRLQCRGWPNCEFCPLCNQVLESAAHLLYQYRYTIRVWNDIGLARGSITACLAIVPI